MSGLKVHTGDQKWLSHQYTVKPVISGCQRQTELNTGWPLSTVTWFKTKKRHAILCQYHNWDLTEKKVQRLKNGVLVEHAREGHLPAFSGHPQICSSLKHSNFLPTTELKKVIVCSIIANLVFTRRTIDRGQSTKRLNASHFWCFA